MARKEINLDGNYNFPTPLYAEAHFNRFRQTKFYLNHQAARKHLRRWKRKLEEDIKVHEALAYIFSFEKLEEGDTRHYFLSLADYLITFSVRILFIKETGEVAFQADFNISDQQENGLGHLTEAHKLEQAA